MPARRWTWCPRTRAARPSRGSSSVVIILRWLGAGDRHRKERTMSHDKIKAAARMRMATTGEPYAAARRRAISEHSADQVTSAVSAEDIRAAAAAHRELGPEYSDAVVASFIEKVDRALAARVEARLGDRERSKPAKPARRGQRSLTRRVARDVLIAGAGALVAIGAVGLHEITSPHRAEPATRLANGVCASSVSSSRCVELPPGFEFVRSLVIRNGRITGVVSVHGSTDR